MSVTLTCECCQVTVTFTSAQAAQDAGWDCPPHVSKWVACNLCPSSLIVLGEISRHARAHRRWREYGRPESFTEQFRWGDLPTRSDDS